MVEWQYQEDWNGGESKEDKYGDNKHGSTIGCIVLWHELKIGPVSYLDT